MLISALNVVMPPPHNAGRYVDLLLMAQAMKQAINLRGEFQGMLGSAHIEDDGHGDIYVTGEIYKYFNLNLDAQWFNMEEHKPAEEGELTAVRIPEHLKPHFRFLPYIFFPRQHRLFLISKDGKDSITAGQAQKLLTALFSMSRIVEAFGEVQVHVEPSKETLRRILSIPQLKRLHIEVMPPNPDDFQEAERALFEEMDVQNAGKMIQTITAKDREGLTPSQKTKTLAKIAKSNGHVEGTGVDEEGKTINVSTLDHPMQEKTTYNPATQSRMGVLREKALDMLHRVIL